MAITPYRNNRTPGPAVGERKPGQEPPPRARTRVNAKSRSGQGGGQDPGMTSNPVAQQADGHIRAGIPLYRAHPVQGGPAGDAHHGGPVALVQAAVILPELHVQGAVQALLHTSVAADRGVPCAPGSDCADRNRSGPGRCATLDDRHCVRRSHGPPAPPI